MTFVDRCVYSVIAGCSSHIVPDTQAPGAVMETAHTLRAQRSRFNSSRGRGWVVLAARKETYHLACAVFLFLANSGALVFTGDY